MSARAGIPDLSTIGGRWRFERQRLNLSQTALATLLGISRRAIISWEGGPSCTATPATLAAFAAAEADVLFIVTGQRVQGEPAPAQEPLAGVTVRQALAMLDPIDRHRLLLDLLAEALNA